VIDLKYKDAEKKAQEALKKGHSIKLGADYLVIVSPKGREEFEVEKEKKVSMRA
jgi:hypothetical protein